MKTKEKSCRSEIKISVPQSAVDTWNGLEKDAVHAKTLHDFKADVNDRR